MGKWAEALAQEIARTPSEGTDETDTTSGVTLGNGVSSVLAVPEEEVTEIFRKVAESADESDQRPAPRPWRLAYEAIERAHAVAWDDAALGWFLARVAALQHRGLDLEDAEDIAEALHLRDVDGDDRRACGECAHLLGHALVGWRCRVPHAAGIGPGMGCNAPGELQRCLGFQPIAAATTVGTHDARW